MSILFAFLASLFLAWIFIIFQQFPIIPLLFVGLITFFAIFFLFPKTTLFFFLLFMLFQGVFTYLMRAGILFNFDELGMVVMSVLVIARRLVLRKPFLTSRIDIPLMLLIALGVCSSVLHKIVPYWVALGGLFLFLKGFLFYYIFLNLEITERDIGVFKKWLYRIGVFTLIYGVLGVVWPKVFLISIGIRPTGRFGFPALQSYLGHPGGFSAFMGVLLCFAVGDWLTKKKFKYGMLCIVFLLGIIFSLRRTTLAGVVLAFLLAMSFNAMRRVIQQRIVVKVWLAIVAVCVIFSSVLFVSYKDLARYVQDESPRSVLLMTGARIAMDYFPLGSGFGTFSGGINQKHYSPLFYKYRISNVWGLSEENSSFVNDTFWPHIYAETGVFGFLCYLAIIFIFFRICFKAARTAGSKEAAGFSVITFMLLVLSLVESSKATFYEISLWTFFYFGSVGVLQSWLARNGNRHAYSHH